MRKKYSPYKSLNEKLVSKKTHKPEKAQHSYHLEENVYTINAGESNGRKHLKETVYTSVVPQHRRAKYLSNEEITCRIKENDHVQAFREQTTYLSKVVFGKSNIFQKKMDDILQNSDIGAGLSREILANPRSFHSLAGYNFCGFKTKARKEAENNLVWLCAALDAYTDVVKQMREQLTYTLATQEEHLGVKTEKMTQYFQRSQERQQHSKKQETHSRRQFPQQRTVM